MSLSRTLKILLSSILGFAIYMAIVYSMFKITGKIFLNYFVSAFFIGFVIIFATRLLLSKESLNKLRISKIK